MGVKYVSLFVGSLYSVPRMRGARNDDYGVYIVARFLPSLYIKRRFGVSAKGRMVFARLRRKKRLPGDFKFYFNFRHAAFIGLYGVII